MATAQAIAGASCGDARVAAGCAPTFGDPPGLHGSPAFLSALAALETRLASRLDAMHSQLSCFTSALSVGSEGRLLSREAAATDCDSSPEAMAASRAEVDFLVKNDAISTGNSPNICLKHFSAVHTPIIATATDVVAPVTWEVVECLEVAEQDVCAAARWPA